MVHLQRYNNNVSGLNHFSDNFVVFDFRLSTVPKNLSGDRYGGKEGEVRDGDDERGEGERRRKGGARYGTGMMSERGREKEKGGRGTGRG